MRDRTELFGALARSRFRSRWALSADDAAYIRSRGIEQVVEHARTFIVQRLAPARPRNDGRQTPTKGHPVFIAQHAVAACCRGCLAKWHHIERSRPLTEPEIDYVVDVIRTWLNGQLAAAGVSDVETQREQLLF